MRRLKVILFMLFAAIPLGASTADPLKDGFANPPASARPRVWWHWMNGNVTLDGIEKDLAWMKRVGIGGVQNFDVNLATPQIVEKRLVYMTPDWKAAFKHAVETAETNGLEFAIAASPGWSETGGPWVKPGDGMKKLVWSETLVTGGKRLMGKLPPVPDTTGPYQTVRIFDALGMAGGGDSVQPPRAGGNVAVIAVPSGTAMPAPAFATTGGKPLDGAILADADLESTVDVPTGGKGGAEGIVLTYDKPVTARALRIFMLHARTPFYGSVLKPVLEVEAGGGWRKLTDISLGEAATTVSFPATTARRFRILLKRNTDPAPSGLGGSTPGAQIIDIFSRPYPETAKVGEVRLGSEARVGASEFKAGFDIVNDYYALSDGSTAPGIAKGDVIDLTESVKPDGTLDWTAPKGRNWRVYRFGWSLTGKTNHPATAEATGLEVDKYDPAAVRRYLETYLGMYRDAVGADLIGRRGIRALLTDSIEVGASNWTPRMAAEFKARRGYDLLPWLPALAGEVIGSPAATNQFLYDYRTTLGELVADAHYGTVARVAHENGLIVYGEALENGRPILGDDLAMRRNTDVPMAALWTWNRDEKPRATLIGDMQGAASVAHVYGQNIVAAESMTAANSPWAFAPHDLKRIIDLEFAMGVNRPVVHTSVHQPVDDKKPGLSLLIFGQYFNRHESWAEMAKPWIDYIARTGFMLQQGRNHADIAYFYGEEAPLTGLFEFEVPKGLPKRYAYDFVNAEMLRDALSVDRGEIVASGGARYKALFLGGRSRKMTLATLRRISAMVEAGATLIGNKPEGSPALRDDPKAFVALADRLWTDPRVIATGDVEVGMAKAGFAPDFAYVGDGDILFVHRKLPDGEIYWVNNRENAPLSIDARFRVSGKTPEVWRAINGVAEPVRFMVDGGETHVPLKLGPEDAFFVVFRKNTHLGGVSAIEQPPVSASPPIPISTSWTVAFEPGHGAPASITMPALKPLNEHEDAGVKYFSGVSTYSTSFILPKSVAPGHPLQVDLGQVGDLAEVKVNGKSAGTTWFAPFRLDIGKLVKRGRNSLEVRVANVWANRLIGDKQPGGTKVAFTAAPTYNADAPLRPAGLIGPVTLRVEK